MHDGVEHGDIAARFELQHVGGVAFERLAATFFKQASKDGKILIVMDPRGQALKGHATHMLQFKPGGDVSMLNAIMHV